MATAPKTDTNTADGPRLSLSGSNDGKWIVNYTGPIGDGTPDEAYALVNQLVAKIKAEHGEKVAFSRGGAKPAGAGAPRANPAAGKAAPAQSRDPLFCAHCNGEIKAVTFKDGKTFTAQQVSGWGQKLEGYNVPLCSNDYQAAKKGTLVLAAATSADADEGIPF